LWPHCQLWFDFLLSWKIKQSHVCKWKTPKNLIPLCTRQTKMVLSPLAWHVESWMLLVFKLGFSLIQE
jgi:hypothetical protein